MKDLMEDLDLLSLTISNNIILKDNVIVFITVNFFFKSVNRLLTSTKKKWLVEE